MFCEKCGCENNDGMKLCKKCRKKSVLIPVLSILCGILFVICVLIFVFIILGNKDMKTPEETGDGIDAVTEGTVDEEPDAGGVSDTSGQEQEQGEPPIIEFDEDFIYTVAQIIPFSLDSYDYVSLVDSTMLQMYILEQNGYESVYFPEIHVGVEPSPIVLTYENIQVGEEATYIRVNCDDMDRFLSSIYGKETIAKLRDNQTEVYYETEYDGTYVTEWGYGYIVSFEGAFDGSCYEGMHVSQEDGTYVCSIHYKYEYYEREEGDITDKWGYSADSIFGWTLLDRQYTMNEESIDVEAEVNQIQEWYYGGGDSETVYDYPADIFVPYSRQYCYHDGKLYFAYINDGGKEYRFYYSYDTNTLLRYIGPDGVAEDFPNIINAPYEYLDQISSER